MRYDPPFHKTNGLVPAVAAVAVLAAFPLVVEAAYLRHIMVLALVFAVVAASWDLSLGFGGLLNFAHIALFAVGIYTYAILAKTLGLNPWLAVLAAGPVAMIIAVMIALPVLRLDGVYVILVTLAFSQLVYQIIISQADITGGTSGMVTLPVLSVGGYRFIKDGKIGYYYTALLLLVLACAFLYGVLRSRWGRAIIALRDNKYAAIARGVPEARTRALALAASALFTGLAGGFYASYVRVASPDILGLGTLTLILSILLVGGTATIWGPVAGAFLIVLLSEAVADYGAWRDILIAGLIIAVMIFYPGGLWGLIQEMRELAANTISATRATLHRRKGKAAREALLGTSEKMVQTRHGVVAVADTGGSCPAILMIHGNSACKEAFTHQFTTFSPDHRLIAFDLPGHGVSDNADPEKSYNVSAYADVAEDVLKACGVERPYVLGWSLGGYVALELTARDPGAFRGLAITGTSPLNIVPDDFARGYDASSHLVLAGKQYFTKSEERAYAGAATAPFSDESAFLHRNIGRTDGRTRYYMITKLGVVDWPRQMRMLRDGTIPFAILNGADDPFLDHVYIAGLPYGRIWSGKPHDIANGLHAPFFNKSREFNDAFAGFLTWSRPE
ncbi:MAG: alpha/beta fold hydrolase [Albidovulum sp.]|uniref:alpha/beta fold hydrolase n=1 Tax=Albidovulum sp. TaxID=1872424 RepID=UPI003C814EE1